MLQRRSKSQSSNSLESFLAAKASQPLPSLKRRQELPPYSSAVVRADPFLMADPLAAAPLRSAVDGLSASLWPTPAANRGEFTSGGTALLFRQWLNSAVQAESQGVWPRFSAAIRAIRGRW